MPMIQCLEKSSPRIGSEPLGKLLVVIRAGLSVRIRLCLPEFSQLSFADFELKIRVGLLQCITETFLCAHFNFFKMRWIYSCFQKKADHVLAEKDGKKRKNQNEHEDVSRRERCESRAKTFRQKSEKLVWEIRILCRSS